MKLADPTTIQAFITADVNGDFLALENGIVADRVRLSALETLTAGANRGTGADYTPADLLALSQITTMINGDSAVVQEGGAIFSRIAGAWAQETPATFGSDNARDTAYAKAAGVFLVAGAEVRRPDQNGYMQVYNGTAWVSEQSGMVPVVPTTVAGTGATATRSGASLIAATGNVFLNGIFTSKYNRYKVILNGVTTVAFAPALALALAGVVATAKHDAIRNGVNGLTAGTAEPGQTIAGASWLLVQRSGTAASRFNAEILLSNPAVASPTDGLAAASVVSTPMTAANTNQITNSVLQHSDSTAYDGLQIPIGAGVVTGTVVVYGWNE